MDDEPVGEDESSRGEGEMPRTADLAGRRRRASETAGGLVRRVRRRLDVSQRGLAELLGVEASRVARWETGRTPPGVGELEAVLALVGLRLVAVDAEGEVVDPMSEEAVRDRAGRRYPAHADLRTAGWWIPPGSWLTGRAGADERRSAALGDPQVYYDLGWQRDAVRHFYGVPDDHLTLARILARLRAQDAERRRAS
ncbi:helix-turn-helix domain-containing protein [Nocardioides terrigena]|uniref:helix-turn-helix domain-containing protein n=1 Tax=Nocardioides terrigena TaxID=424797 RepID=UPI0019006680|nr:helix-turn-helix transcriptional regulator [Nocardioides terrigena]